MNLRVYEIFYSLQGEGVDVGVPAVFLRLAGCNLRCGSCDTPYAWDGGDALSYSLLLSRLEAFPCRYLVVTGGEPMLQARALGGFLPLLSSWTLTLETNATIWEPEVLGMFHLITASPKLSSRGAGPFPHEAFGRFMASLADRLQVKLVVDRGDWEEVESLLESYPSLGNGVPLVIQPLESQGSLEDYLERVRDLARSFLERAPSWGRKEVRFLPQIHKILWWGEKGV